MNTLCHRRAPSSNRSTPQTPNHTPLIVCVCIYRYFPEQCKNPICVPGPDAPCTHTVCFPQPRPAIYYIEVFAMLVFTVDYLVRVACVHAVPYRCVDWPMGRLADLLGSDGCAHPSRRRPCLSELIHPHHRLIHPECFVKGYLVRPLFSASINIHTWRSLSRHLPHHPPTIQADHLEPNGLTKTVSYLFSFLNIVDL